MDCLNNQSIINTKTDEIIFQEQNQNKIGTIANFDFEVRTRLLTIFLSLSMKDDLLDLRETRKNHFTRSFLSVIRTARQRFLKFDFNVK